MLGEEPGHAIADRSALGHQPRRLVTPAVARQAPQADGQRHLEVLVVEPAQVGCVADDAVAFRRNQQGGHVGAVVERRQALRERRIRVPRQLHRRPLAHQATDYQWTSARHHRAEIEGTLSSMRYSSIAAGAGIVPECSSITDLPSCLRHAPPPRSRPA